MPNAYNMEFRDMSREACYPFTADSSLAGDLLVLPRYFLLDAILYPVAEALPPYHLYSISGSSGEDAEEAAAATSLRLAFRDAGLREIGACTLKGEEVAMVEDANGLIIGTVVCSLDGFDEVRGKLSARTAYFAPSAAEMAAGRTFLPKTDGGLLVSTEAGLFTDDVVLTAADGMHFELDGDVVRINLYGELRTLQMPIKTINGIEMTHAWLAAHPGQPNTVSSSSSNTDCDIEGSELRVITQDHIKIGKAKDFTYGE